MVRQNIIVEEGGSYRKEDVDGAKITTMCLVEREKGGLVALLDFDDEKGAATYNLTMKEEIMGHDNNNKDRVVSDFFDFGKINKALIQLGYIPWMDFTTKEWGTEPPITGKPAWIKMQKTGTGKDKNGQPIEYKALIDIVKIGDSTPGTKPTNNAGKPTTPPPSAVKGELTPELYESWKKASGLIVSPMNEIGITQAIKKAYPTDAGLRTSLAEVRVKALIKLVEDGILSKQTTPEGVVYDQAV